MRIFHAVTYTCSGGEVEHGIKRPVFLEEIVKFVLLFDVEFVEAKLFSVFVPLEFTQPPIFESDVVIIVEVVDTDHLIPILKQFPTYLRGDKASGSGNEVSFTQA